MAHLDLTSVSPPDEMDEDSQSNKDDTDLPPPDATANKTLRPPPDDLAPPPGKRKLWDSESSTTTSNSSEISTSPVSKKRRIADETNAVVVRFIYYFFFFAQHKHPSDFFTLWVWKNLFQKNISQLYRSVWNANNFFRGSNNPSTPRRDFFFSCFFPGGQGPDKTEKKMKNAKFLNNPNSKRTIRS